MKKKKKTRVSNALYFMLVQHDREWSRAALTPVL